jgi:small ligand-binding sensory domain FIST
VVLGEDCEREVVAIQKALGGVALSGFFSFGEIGPSARGRLAFYNQTAILALLRETSR